MVKPGRPGFVSQAEFSRLRGVSKKTVTSWKQSGYLVLEESGLVDVVETNERLACRNTVGLGVTGGNAEGNSGGNEAEAPSNAPVGLSGPRAKTETMAKILNISVVHLGRLAKEKKIPGPAERGVWDVISVANAYIAGLKEKSDKQRESDGGIKSEELLLTVARREKTEAEFESQAMKNAIMRGDFVAVEAVGIEVEQAFSAVRERLLSMPGKISSSLVGRSYSQIDDVLQKEVADALDELRRPSDIVGLAVDLTAQASGGDEDIRGAAEADPNRVGGSI